MTDGPSASLSRNRRWKRVARSYEIGDDVAVTRANIQDAVEGDCRRSMSAIVPALRRIFDDNGQPDLFAAVDQSRIERLRQNAGSDPLAKRLLDRCRYLADLGQFGPAALPSALAGVVTEHAGDHLTHIMQHAEVELKDPHQLKTIREGVQRDRQHIDVSDICNALLEGSPKPVVRRVSDAKGLDDGPGLGP